MEVIILAREEVVIRSQKRGVSKQDRGWSTGQIGDMVHLIGPPTAGKKFSKAMAWTDKPDMHCRRVESMPRAEGGGGPVRRRRDRSDDRGDQPARFHT